MSQSQPSIILRDCCSLGRLVLQRKHGRLASDDESTAALSGLASLRIVLQSYVHSCHVHDAAFGRHQRRNWPSAPAIPGTGPLIEIVYAFEGDHSEFNFFVSFKSAEHPGLSPDGLP